jgi:two-component system, chemotaxis family, chemotaxis protein CheY
MARTTFPILVVDDDADLLQALREILRDEGYVVACVENGRQAMDVLRAGARPCVILLDIRMPAMDGLAFRREQLEDQTIAKIPVVFFTADPSEEDEARRLGVEFYLKKPVDLLQLLEVVAHHCDDPDRLDRPALRRSSAGL